MSTENGEGAGSTPRHIRLQVELVVEITDSGALTSAALEQVREDQYMPDDEREHAAASIDSDPAEALAYLIDPFDLVDEIPGIELAQASWQSVHTEYDPESDEWDLYEDEDPEGEAGPDGEGAGG
ncbi:hypothetical protein ACFV1B_18285 [Streptomyces sp. NPDC059637]|uniref:hypothetical protein n=1 Tax=Streptomyces sp. NPDC059637 TaxID=3347752 RepID=UPI00367E1706